VSQLAVPASTRLSSASNRAAIIWGIGLGIIQAATPLVFWWLDGSTVYALGLAAIAAIYVGFAVSDGRVKIIAIETAWRSPSFSSAPPRSPAPPGCW
jgi:uncharacterized membrane protein